MNTRLLACLLLALAVLLFAGPRPSSAEEKEPPATLEQLQTRINLIADYVKRLEGQMTNGLDSDSRITEAYVAARVKDFEYRAELRDAAIKAMKLQRLASNVVLFLVVVVVGAGVGFAGFQLWKSVSVAGVQNSTDLELSASNVRVTSSVVGVVVLTLSLAFLYIYTKEIYHIKFVDPGAIATRTAGPN